MKHKCWWPEAGGNKMARKPIIIGVSLILVVGVVIGTVLVNRNSHSSNDKGLSTNIKSVDAICGSTTYKDKCMSTIAPIATNASAGPKDFLRAVLVATIEAMKGGLEKSHSIKIDNLERINKLALEECKKFIQYSVEDLEVALAKLEENELNTVNDQLHEFLNVLSAVTAYQKTCIDQLEDPNVKAEIGNGLLNATLVTTNAADIFVELPTILAAFNIPLNVNPNHRKLLDVGSVDEQGYPHWLSEGDRRLLAGKANPTDVTVTVAKDGSGNFGSIGEALIHYPQKLAPQSRYVIHVKAGIYKEVNLTVSKKHVNVFMYGDGKDKTIITGDKNYGKLKYPTSATGSLTVAGNNFLCKSIGFINFAGPEGHQAAALTVQSHQAAFFDCSMDGFQDTLYAHANFQFYRDCVISGTIDFVFGMSTTVIQNSLITVKQPGVNQTWTVVAADGRNSTAKTGGLVFQNCSIIPGKDLFDLNPKLEAYLARPWSNHSHAIFMDSFIDGFIHPLGFHNWNDTTPNTDHCRFIEYRNRGPGSITNRRIEWPNCVKVFTRPEDVKTFTVREFIKGGTWLGSTGFPFYLDH